MNLKFEKINNWFVSEFEVTQDFNIHIEKEAGSILFYQRTAGSEYDIIHDLGPHKGNERVMDLDFSTFIYPKYIKIKSKVLPTVATITTDGEVNEVVYQAKDIEITSNGTTKVTADTGYTALGSVNVKVNVPTEGGGGESVSSWKFFDVSNIENKAMTVGLLPFIAKNDTGIVFSLIVKDWSAVSAVGVDAEAKIRMQGMTLTWAEAMAIEGLPPEVMAQVGIVEITKEEFYNLNA